MTIDDNTREGRSGAPAKPDIPSDDKSVHTAPVAPLSTPKPLSTPAAPLSVPKALSTPRTLSTPCPDPPVHSEPALQASGAPTPGEMPLSEREAVPLPEQGATAAIAPGKKRRRRRRRNVGPRDEVLVELRRFFRIQNFRPKQRDVIAAILDGRDTVAIMPTGSGKSLTYQMAARVMPGLTIVISPLIALLRDQHEKLLKYGLDGVRFDSSLTPRQREKTLAELEAGEHKLLLITPESIVSEEFRTRISERDVSLLVIDEAHCVSQWGHDFRPSYLALKSVAEDLGEPPILALTATATPKVQEDIIHQLGMEDPVRIVAPPDRPNLSFSVELHDSEMTKLRSILHHVRVLPRPGIIYCATTRDVEMVWAMLRKARIQAEYYHGKLLKSERDAAHSAFMSGRNPLVMVATNAFGLGVDKPNIRYVLHYQVPGSLEAYVQEAGRAGRDGKPSRCILLYDEKDLEIQEYFLEQQYPTRSQVRHVAEALSAWSERGEPVTLRDLALSAHVPQTRTSVVLRLLQDLSFASEVEMGKAVTLAKPPEMEEVERAAAIYDVQRVHDRRRLGDLTAYATTTECRSSFIQGYFGAEQTAACGHCDNDMAPEARAQLDRETRAVMETPVTLKKKRRKDRRVEKKKMRKAVAAMPVAMPAQAEDEPRKKRRRRRKKKNAAEAQAMAASAPQDNPSRTETPAAPIPQVRPQQPAAPPPSPADASRLLRPASMARAADEPAHAPRYAAPLDSGEPPSRHRRRRRKGGLGRAHELQAASTVPAPDIPAVAGAAPAAAVPRSPLPPPTSTASDTPFTATPPISQNTAVATPEGESLPEVRPPPPKASRTTRRRRQSTAAATLPEPFARAAENLRAILAAGNISALAEARSAAQQRAPRKARSSGASKTGAESTQGTSDNAEALGTQSRRARIAKILPDES